MAAFLLRRASQSLAILFVVATFTFVLLHAAPGDPVDAIVNNERLQPEVRQRLRQQYGLDRPLPEQYARQMLGVMRGTSDSRSPSNSPSSGSSPRRPRPRCG